MARKAIAIGREVDLSALKLQHADCLWLAHIVDPGLADGFLLDHGPDMIVVSSDAAHRIPGLQQRYPHLDVRGSNDQQRRESDQPAYAVCTDAQPAAQVAGVETQLMAIWSPKGGVGKSFVASNLAVACALRGEGSVALLDLDLYSADVGVYLDLLEGPSLVELLPHLPDLAPEDLCKYMVQHRSSSLWVLLGPSRPELGDFASAQQIKSIVQLARQQFAWVFADLPPHAGEDMVYATLEQSATIILVTTQDAATLRQTRLTLETLRRLRIDVAERVKIVLNRYHVHEGIAVARLADFLGHPVCFTIAEDRPAADSALFEGVPIVLRRPRSTLGSALEQLSLALWGKEHSQEQPKLGLLEVLRRRFVDGIAGSS